MAALPPGPARSPLVQTVAYHRDPLGLLRRARARHGSVFALRLAGKGPLVIVADPAAVDGLLDSDPERAAAGAARRFILPAASPASPFGADGDAHRAVRAVMEPAFAPEALAAREHELAAVAAAHVEGWPAGRPFRLLPRMRTIAAEAFVRVVLRIADPARRDALVLAVRRMLLTPGNPPVGVPGPQDGPAGRAVTALLRRRMAPVLALVADEARRRHAAADPGDDLLGRLVAAGTTPEHAADRLLVVLAAAQEPGAIALTNVVYELARHPGLQDRFLEQPDARGALVDEALRLRPAASAALRELRRDERVDGHLLPAGADVAVPSPLLHRDPRSWRDPDAFDAARFAAGPPPGAPFFPFGGGARRCIGEPLARAELRAVLPVLLERRRFAPAWPREERMVVRGTVLVPHRSALVRAPRRVA
jgi:cytochrome P450